MSRAASGSWRPSRWLSRARGDEPAWRDREYPDDGAPPRTRGWTLGRLLGVAGARGSGATGPARVAWTPSGVVGKALPLANPMCRFPSDRVAEGAIVAPGRSLRGF